MNRVVFVSLTILCLLSIWSITGLIQVVKADGGTITINADGSITPSTAPIHSTDNITYTLTGNITAVTDGIVVERDNIVLEGAGFTVQGDGTGNGIDLSNRTNVAIENMTIKAFEIGIWLNSSSNHISISGNNITANNENGIDLESSSNNSIFESNITNNSLYGIDLRFSSSSTVSGNNVANNSLGIYLYSSSGNTLSGNTLSGNNAANSYSGIYLDSSSNNVLSGNNVTANSEYGIRLYSSPNNTLSGNVMVDNEHNFGVDGTGFSEFLQSIDTSNLVDGKPVYYFVNKSNIMVNPDAYPEVGYLGFVNCANVTLLGMNLTNNRQGLLLAYTNDSEITGNNAANNDEGIVLHASSGNTLSGNNVTANNRYGILLETYSDNNTLSGNSIVNHWDGIMLVDSSSNTLLGNNVTANVKDSSVDDGISLASSSNNTLLGNNIVNNWNGITLLNSSSNILLGNNVTATGNKGIVLYTSANNVLSGNNIANNYFGIWFYSYSRNNNLSGNNVTNNNIGILIYMGSSNNRIFHNDFVNNTNQAQTDGLANIWDNGSVGNYWSDYMTKYPNATQVDSSGVWNTPYALLYYLLDQFDTSNTDYYPLMVQYVIPEFPSSLVLPIFMIATLLAVIVYKKKGTNTRQLVKPRGNAIKTEIKSAQQQKDKLGV